MPQLLEHCAVTRPWTMAASQAVALLGRYKESGPPDEHAVDLMLQALKKDLAATPPGR